MEAVFPFYRRESWGSGKWSELFKVMHLLEDRAGSPTLGCLNLEPMLLSLDVGILWLVPSSFTKTSVQIGRISRPPQALLFPLSPVHLPVSSLLSVLCSNYPISAQMVRDVTRVTDNFSLRNPEEILGRLDKKPLSDILILVFSLVSPFRKYLFNTSFVLPFSRLHFAKVPVITSPLPRSFARPPAVLVLGKTWVLCSASAARNMSEFHLASLMPSFISMRHLPAFCVPSSLDSLRLFQILLPMCKWTLCMCEFPSKGTAMKCSFPDWFLPSLPRFILKHLPLQGHTSRWAVLSWVSLTLGCRVQSLHLITCPSLTDRGVKFLLALRGTIVRLWLTLASWSSEWVTTRHYS